MSTMGKHLGGVRTLADLKARCEEVGECWEWQRHINSCGVAQILFDGMTRPARRVAWVLVNGSVADGMRITHTCGNHRCINPAHSKQVTQKAILKRNMDGANHALRVARMAATKRKQMGVPAQVVSAVRADSTTPAKEMAATLGVSTATIYKLRRQALAASPFGGLLALGSRV